MKTGTTAARLLVVGSLAALILWPLAATVLEATHAPWILRRVLVRVGAGPAAEWIAGVWGQEPESAAGTALDPAATADLLRESGRLPRPVRLAIETLRLVGGVLALTMPPAIVLASLIFRTNLWRRSCLLAVLAVSVFIPLPLYATSWLGALGNAGRSQAMGNAPVLVGRTGAIIVHSLAGLPWAVLLVGVGLCTVEPELEESARLDMPLARVWTRVTLRRGAAAILTASLGLAVLTAGDMTVTDLLQIRTYAEEAYTQYSLGNGPGDAALVSVPPLIVLGFAILLAAQWLARADPARLAAAYARNRPWPLGRWRIPLSLLSLVIVGFLAGVPLYALIWRAGRVGGRARLGLPPIWSWNGLWGTLTYAADDSASPMATSLVLAAVAASVAVTLAWSLAWLSRDNRAMRRLMLATLAITLAAPGPVAGMGLKLAYRWFPLIHDTPAIVVLAQAARTLPYTILILWPALAILPAELLESASLDGLGPGGQALRVALPLTWKPSLAAWFVAFVLGFGELPASNLLLPPGVTTITFHLWTLLHTGVESHLAGVALVTLAVVAALVLGMLAAFRLAAIRIQGR